MDSSDVLVALVAEVIFVKVITVTIIECKDARLVYIFHQAVVKCQLQRLRWFTSLQANLKPATFDALFRLRTNRTCSLLLSRGCH